MALVLGLAEIGAFEEFRRQHHLRALAGGLADQFGDVADILAHIRAESELERGDIKTGHAGTCWLMQWKLPPPVRIWSARSPTAARSGKSVWIAATAASSLGAPYCGTTTAALPI